MAVGRLPRNQRNLGGAGRPPRDQRTDDTATAAPKRAARSTAPRVRSVGVEYPAVRWEATLREPLGAFPHGPRTFVVDVVGNTDLQGVPVDLRVEPRDKTITPWYPAAWLSTDGNRGTMTAHVPNPPYGHGTVLVRPTAAGQRPVLPAGRVVVQ